MEPFIGSVVPTGAEDARHAMPHHRHRHHHPLPNAIRGGGWEGEVLVVIMMRRARQCPAPCEMQWSICTMPSTRDRERQCVLSVTTASRMCVCLNLDCYCAMKLPASSSDPAKTMQGIIRRLGAPSKRCQDGNDAGCTAAGVGRLDGGSQCRGSWHQESHRAVCGTGSERKQHWDVGAWPAPQF
jgi:hypothetical protein